MSIILPDSSMPATSTMQLGVMTNSNVEISPLQNNTTYYFNVTAIKQSTEGTASASISTMPQSSLGTFTAPTNLTITEPDDGTLKLSWDSLARSNQTTASIIH